MDKRQHKTRRAIFEAFNSLLSRKKYDKITINDIINEAEISRSTFYDHFKSKDDLLKLMNDSLFQHVFSDSLKAEHSHDFSGIHQDASSFITHTLYHLKDDYNNLKGILSCESSSLFWQYLKNEFSVVVKNHLLTSEYMPSSKLPRHILINHISLTFIELVQIWFNNNIKESPEEIEEYFELLISPIISGK